MITVVCQNLFPLISCPQPSHINVVFKEINHLTSYFSEIVYVSSPNMMTPMMMTPMMTMAMMMAMTIIIMTKMLIC